MSWPLVKLSEVCTLINGRAYGRDELLPDGKYEVLRVGNLFSNKDWYYSDLELPEDKYCDNGDLLYAWSASFGPRIWDGGKVIYHYHIWKVVINESLVDKKYLFYALKNDVESIKREQGTGSTMIHVTKSAMENRLIPLPPLPEQKRIAAILDKADAIRRKRQQAIQLTDDFLRAVFLEMFGDPRDSLTIEDMLNQNYLRLHKDGNHGSNYPAKEEFGDDGVAFISAKDISDRDGSIDYASVAHLNESKAKKLTIGWLEKGDVLLAHNATVGRIGLFDGEVDKALIGTSLTAFRPNQDKLSSVYLFAALKYSIFQDQLKKNMGQSTRNQVPITAQKSLKIPVGDLRKQKQFEQAFTKLKQAKLNLYDGLKKSDEMFSSLSQKAFAGQL